MSNPRVDHWKATKQVMQYLKRTKDSMLTYKRSLSIMISILLDVKIANDSNKAIFSCWLEELYLEECQTDTYRFLGYDNRVYCLL